MPTSRASCSKPNALSRSRDSSGKVCTYGWRVGGSYRSYAKLCRHVARDVRASASRSLGAGVCRSAWKTPWKSLGNDKSLRDREPTFQANLLKASINKNLINAPRQGGRIRGRPNLHSSWCHVEVETLEGKIRFYLEDGSEKWTNWSFLLFFNFIAKRSSSIDTKLLLLSELEHPIVTCKFQVSIIHGTKIEFYS